MPGKFAKIIGHNVRILRELKGVTQHYLGSLAGISQSAVSKNEHGENDLDLETAWHFCRFFGCPMEDLLRQRRWSDAPYTDEQPPVPPADPTARPSA